MVPWSPLFSTISVNGVQAVAFLLIFEIFRRSKRFGPIFKPRHIVNPHRTPPNLLDRTPGVLFWIRDTLRVSSAETLRCAGLDAYVFLRFLRFGVVLTAITTPFAVMVLIPTYATGDNFRNDTDTGGYNSVTMANVQNGSHRLWASLGFFVFLVGVTLKLLWLEWEHFLPLRLRFIAHGDEDASVEFRYAVRVENVPAQYRSSGALFKLFDHLFPGQVKTATMCVNIAEMDKQMEERKKAILAIEAAEAKKAHKPRKGEPTTKIDGHGCLGGQKVQVVSHYTEELKRLNKDLEDEHTNLMDFLVRLNQTTICAPELPEKQTQGKFRPSVPSSKSITTMSTGLKNLVSGGNGLPIPSDPTLVEKWVEHLSTTGFVLFNTLAAKQAALQMELDGKMNSMEAEPASELNDMQWENVTNPKPKQQTNTFIANGLWTAGVLFWTFPVLGVQFIANIKTLEEDLGLWVPERTSFLYGLLSGYLPVIGMIVLLTLVPLAIQASALKFIKIKSISEADMYTFRWHFAFQVANLWIVLIGGSLFNQLNKFIEAPTNALDLVASAVPGASLFFMNLVITQTFSGLFLELSGIVQIVLSFVLGQLKPEQAKTQRELNAAIEAPFIKWGWVIPPMILITFVTFVYSAIVPLMEVFSCLFFVCAYIIFKHQILNKYVSRGEGGGLIWLKLFDMIMGCLYMSEFIFLAYLGIKESVLQGPCVILLIVITRFVHTKMKAAFRSQCLVAPLLLVRDIDCEAAGEEVLEAKEEALTEEGMESGDSQFISTSVVEPPNSNALEMERFLDDFVYAQPSLRKKTWESKPLPYRTTSDSGVCFFP